MRESLITIIHAADKDAEICGISYKNLEIIRPGDSDR